MKAGLATPEQLRKARAEQRREQRREPRGKRKAQDGTRTPGRRAPKRSRPPPVPQAGAAGREPGHREDGGFPADPQGDDPRRRKGEPRRRPTEPAAGQDPDVHALNLRIRELLDRHAQNDRNADIAFNLTRENTVRRVYVTKEQRRKLASGELAVVGFRRRHHIVPARVADEIHALRPIVFVHRATLDDDAAATDAAAADDPYRDFPIPDDLHW